MWQMHMGKAYVVHKAHACEPDVHLPCIYVPHIYEQQKVMRRRRQGGCGGRSPPLVFITLDRMAASLCHLIMLVGIDCAKLSCIGPETWWDYDVYDVFYNAFFPIQAFLLGSYYLLKNRSVLAALGGSENPPGGSRKPPGASC